jgi:hypothetical protein
MRAAMNPRTRANHVSKPTAGKMSQSIQLLPAGSGLTRRWTATMQIRGPLIVLALLFSGAASCNSPFASTEELQRWLTYYYVKPQPELTVRSLPVLDAAMRENKNRSLADEVGRGGMRSFYAKVLEANDPVVRELEAELASLSEDIQTFAREALRRCGSAECARVVETLKPGVSESAPSASTLDDSWAAFMATGDTRYVDEVISELPLVEVRGDPDRLIIGGAARWSLASNAYQHEKVLAACEAALESADATTKRLLEEIIAEAKAERAARPPAKPW